MVWRAHQSSVPPFACHLYKAIFPMITPTMKNKTTSARSRALRPSSFTAAANAGTGLLLCAVFLIRSPSSSYGSKRTFQRQPKAPAAEVTVQPSRMGLYTDLNHTVWASLLIFQREKLNPTEKALA